MKSPKRQLLIFCLAAVLLAGGFVLFDTAHEFRRDLDLARVEQERHAELLVEHAQLSFRGMDILMSSVTAAFRRVPPQILLDDPSLSVNLKHALDYIPQLATIAIYDASGNEVVWMGESSANALSVKGTDVIEVFKHSGDIRHVGGLLRDAELGRNFISMSARITSIHGEFYGAVFTLLDLSYFERFHKQLDPDGNRRVGMYRKGGVVLTLSDTPADTKPQADPEAVRAILPFTTYVGASPLDGSKRIIAYQRLNGYPISMTVSEDYQSFVRSHHGLWARRGLLFLVVILAARICYKAINRSIASAEALREKRLQMMQQQRNFERISREIIHHIPNGRAAVLDMDLRYLFADGRAFREHERLAPTRVIGKRIQDVHRPEVAATLEKIIQHAINTGEAAADAVAGRELVYEVTAVPLRDENERIDRLLLLSQDITNFHRTRQTLEARNLELQEISVTDSLLGISNRRGLDNQLAREWSRSQRKKLPLSLLMIDVDHFKIFNDTYGHAAGDECLRQVAATIGEAVFRPNDLVARYGGEEIAVLLPATDRKGALEVAGRIHLALKEKAIPFPGSPITPYLTLSIGVASLVPGPNESPDSILQIADSALYRAKQAGRNRTFVREAEDVAVTES